MNLMRKIAKVVYINNKKDECVIRLLDHKTRKYNHITVKKSKATEVVREYRQNFQLGAKTIRRSER